MKNVSLALNGILLVAVAILYYWHFASGSKSSAAAASENTAPSDFKIAYINSDTVLKYYDFFKSNIEKLEAKGKKLDQDLQSRAQSLQNDIAAYQRNYGSMTIGQAKAIEEDLGKKRQNLELYQRSLEQQIMEENAKMNEELYTKVTDYLKKYAQQKDLHAVLKYSANSDLLYGGASIDITQEVVAGLNELYKQELAAAPKAKTDTTKVKAKK
ncbi:MAG: OmpH family outer membrane protein [Cyclobacteriaceae bacterium]|nr:OmpH family outer membrane protein [Cyclobacteriaceae bacterium]